MKRATVVAVAVVVAVMAAGFAWAADPCPCDSVKNRRTVQRAPLAQRAKAVRGTSSRAVRPSFTVGAASAFAAARPEVKRDTVVIHRDVFREISRAPVRETWLQRNDRWLIPVAILTAGVVGYHLRGCDEGDRVVVVGGGGGRDDCGGRGDRDD